MIKWLLRRWIAKFEAHGTMTRATCTMCSMPIRGADGFQQGHRLGRYHKDAPPAAYCAAGIVGTMAEDCGPCTQLIVDMAVREGVDPKVLRAVVSREFSAHAVRRSLAVRFAEASLQHAPEADDLREEVVRRWGKRALVSLAFAITASRFFPTVKYAMGHGRACTRVTVAGESRPVFAN